MEFGKIGDHDLMEKALKEKYGSVTRYGTTYMFMVNGRRVTLRGNELESDYLGTAQLQQVTSDIKKAYSRESVKASAKRFGWLVQPGADEDHFVIVKR